MGGNVSTSPEAGNMNAIAREDIDSLVNTY